MNVGESRKKTLVFKHKNCAVKVFKHSDLSVHVKAACSKPRRIAFTTCPDDPEQIKLAINKMLRRVVVW